MAGVLISLCAAIVMMALWNSPATSQTANPAVSQIQPVAALVAELAKSIDAKKTKPNDPVVVLLTMDVLAHGQIVIPRGTKIIGHVSGARARSPHVPGSRVEIAFDRIVLKNGLELPVHATIRAIGAPLRAAFPDSGASSDVDLPSFASTRPAPGPNERRAIDSTTFPGSRRPGVADGSSKEPVNPIGAVGLSLGPASEGVVAIKGIELTSTAQTSSITSTRENFQLRRGTQLVLRISNPKLLLDSLQRSRESTRVQPRK